MVDAEANGKEMLRSYHSKLMELASHNVLFESRHAILHPGVDNVYQLLGIQNVHVLVRVVSISMRLCRYNIRYPSVGDIFMSLDESSPTSHPEASSSHGRALCRDSHSVATDSRLLLHNWMC